VGVASAVAVCGTALTPEHVEVLARTDCREVTILFDGDAAGLAAPAKAAAALFPSGMSGKVAVLPSAAGKTDPDELSTFLVERAIDRTCAGAPREAPLEAKLAAVRELEPFVRMMPEGLARSVFEETIARRLELDAGALRAELAGERPRPGAAPQRRPAPPPQQPDARRTAASPPGRTKLLLPGPAADALGLLAAFPELGSVAEEENLAGLLPGPLAELARDLARGAVSPEEALARLGERADAATVRRVTEIAGPARPAREAAERELRKAAIKAAIEAVRVEQDRLLALVVKHGAPVPEDLAVATQVAQRRRVDLEKRLRSMERAG
jgi:DNA primase